MSRIIWRTLVAVGLAQGCTVGSPLPAPQSQSLSPPAPQPRAEVPRAEPVMLDFSFVNGVPVSGTRLTACGKLTVSTTNTERFGTGSFRNDLSGKDAKVALTFDRPIRTFDLAVSYVRADEYLAGFNVETPQRLSGTLTQTANGRVTTSHPFPADDGAGSLSWLNLQTREVELVVGGPRGSAIAIDAFFVACVP